MESSPPTIDRPPRDLRPSALLAGGVLFGITLTVYVLTASQRWAIDGIGLFVLQHDDFGHEYQHVLYRLAGRLYAVLLPGLSAEWQLRALSASTSAGCVAGVYALALRLGARPFRATCAALVLAFSPALWVGATWIEVHTLHAFAVVVAAHLVLGAARWGIVAATAAAAVGLLFVFGTHRSGVVFGPSLVLWVGAACALRGSWRSSGARGRALALVLGVGPVLLATLAAGMAAVNVYRFGELSLGVDETTAYLDRWQSHGTVLGSLVDEWVVPSGLLFACGVVALAFTRGWRRAGLAGFVVPSFLFFLWYGIPEKGGFALASLCFLAVLVALALERLPRPTARVACVALVLVQLVLGGWFQRSWSSVNRFDERVEQVRRALPRGGTLLAISRPRNPSPLLDYFEDDIRELRLQGHLALAVQAGKSDEEVAEVFMTFLDAAAAAGDVAFDVSILVQPAEGARDGVLDAILERLEDTYEVERFDHAYWPVIAVGERRR